MKDITKCHGFAEEFIDWICYISSASYSVLISGSAWIFYYYVLNYAGGSHVPYLIHNFFLTFCPEFCVKLKRKVKFMLLRFLEPAPKIIHLMYTDDLVIYCKAKMSEAQEVKKCWMLFVDGQGSKSTLQNHLYILVKVCHRQRGVQYAV